jgi:4-amino-4-deoxy-L-arabinose transferase-like glycosyltransferase
MIKNSIRFLRTHPWIISCLILLLLIIPAARVHELWGDEAETALFARNILKYGVPKGWDGTNIMGINNAVVLDKNLINHTSPWAQYYMVAGSFALFGESSFTARIPSILLSLFSIPILYYVAKKITGNKRMAFLSTLIACLSVQGILFGFQARYYQLTNMCGLLFLWASVSLLERRIIPKAVFVLSGLVFFYANYVSWSAFYLATFIGVGLCMWMRGGKTNFVKFIKNFLLLSIPIVILAIPWFLLMHPLGDRGGIKFFPLVDTVAMFWYLLRETFRPFHTSGVMPAGLVILMGIVSILRWKDRLFRQTFVLLVILPVLFLFWMVVYTTIADVDTIFTSTRYTTAAIPLFCLMAAYVIVMIIRWKRWVGIGVLCIYLTTNLLTFGHPRSFLYLLVGEILHPYQTPEIVVANYLKVYAKFGDTAFVNLDRDHEPLIFFLGDKIRFVNRVSLVNTRIFPQNRGIIPRYIYDYRDEPDWIIMYSRRGEDGTFFTSDYRGLWQEVDLMNDYTEHSFPVFFSDLSRPEIEMRSFTGVHNPAPIDYVYIYEKKK